MTSSEVMIVRIHEQVWRTKNSIVFELSFAFLKNWSKCPDYHHLRSGQILLSSCKIWHLIHHWLEFFSPTNSSFLHPPLLIPLLEVDNTHIAKKWVVQSHPELRTPYEIMKLSRFLFSFTPVDKTYRLIRLQMKFGKGQ